MFQIINFQKNMFLLRKIFFSKNIKRKEKNYERVNVHTTRFKV